MSKPGVMGWTTGDARPSFCGVAVDEFCEVDRPLVERAIASRSVGVAFLCEACSAKCDAAADAVAAGVLREVVAVPPAYVVTSSGPAPAGAANLSALGDAPWKPAAPAHPAPWPPPFDPLRPWHEHNNAASMWEVCRHDGSVVSYPETERERALLLSVHEMEALLRELAPVAGRCGKRLGGQEERNCKVDDPHACLRCRIVDLVARLPEEGA